MITKNQPNHLYYDFYMSFLGTLLIGVSNTHCFWISFVQTTEEESLFHLKNTYPNCKFDQNSKAISFVCTAIQNYNQNQSSHLHLSGFGTPFQHSVWNELCRIPFGETISYQTLAHRTGKPNALRAVGTAVGKNPISILIPCHRVIRKDGTYHQYRWGKENKETLLNFEGYFRPKSAGISPHC